MRPRTDKRGVGFQKWDMGMGHTNRDGGSFDPDTVEVLKTVLDNAWASLVPAQQARTSKSEMAVRILQAAASGERDPAKLRTTALIFPVG
jgi:hypothetical protein